MKSKVYLCRAKDSSLGAKLAALESLLGSVDLAMDYKKSEIVPVKLTIGDSDCAYYMHPQLVKCILSKITARGAKPFVFDTGVIYKGNRQNALDHLMLAQKKGYAQEQIGAPFIVADGLLGQDGKEYDIDSKHIKSVKVPSFVGMLDSLVVLSHATGHIFTGFAGAVKNVAMGMSCRATKQVQHSSVKPFILENVCVACGCCVQICPVGAIVINKKNKACIDQASCIGCGECLCACKFDAISVNWEEEMDVFCARMDEVAHFILSKFKNKFFITFAFDITQECDCISTKDDRFISRDIGILASCDPLALDAATVDLMGDEHNFLKEHGAYQGMFSYAAKIGLGSLDYELISL